MTKTVHWLVKAADRWVESHKKSCCATMGFNVFMHHKIPDWVVALGKCPWCNRRFAKVRSAR